MASRKLEDLHPQVRDKAQRFIDQSRAAGIDVLITCTYRSNEEQAALFAQGREGLAEVNALRKTAGIAPITAAENKKKVTNAPTGKSEHNKKRAFDVVPLVAGKPVWDGKSPLWQKLGEIGKSCGLEWAGDWKRFKEFPHFQDTTAG